MTVRGKFGPGTGGAMDNNPDSPDSISSDQLTVDLLSPRAKRRRILQTDDIVIDDVDGKNANNNNNSVGFVLMEEEHQENGDIDEEKVRIGASAPAVAGGNARF